MRYNKTKKKSQKSFHQHAQKVLIQKKDIFFKSKIMLAGS